MQDWSQTYLQLALVLTAAMYVVRCVDLWALEQEIREHRDSPAVQHRLKRQRVPLVLTMAMYPVSFVGICWLTLTSCWRRQVNLPYRSRNFRIGGVYGSYYLMVLIFH